MPVVEGIALVVVLVGAVLVADRPPVPPFHFAMKDAWARLHALGFAAPLLSRPRNLGTVPGNRAQNSG